MDMVGEVRVRGGRERGRGREERKGGKKMDMVGGGEGRKKTMSIDKRLD